MSERANGRVVVITGASSGIGRETALELAKPGNALVLAARREQPLEEVKRECEARGAECLVVPTDVSELSEVEWLADAAVTRFGRIDAWVNDAGVYLMGTLEETPLDAFRRVMDVNFYGVVHGTRAAVGQMRRQPEGGVIVNISSQLGSVSGAYLSAYVASKHAVRGFSSSVRQELLDTPIRVCTVMPASIDTPLFEHSANYTGKEIKPAEPVFPPEKVAHTIIRLIDHPRSETYVGGVSTRTFGAVRHAMPDAFDPMMRKQLDKGHFRQRAAQASSGNLYEPLEQGTGVHGGYRGRTKQWGRRFTLFGLAAAGAMAARAFQQRRSEHQAPYARAGTSLPQARIGSTAAARSRRAPLPVELPMPRA